jgi:hypothetical protein
MKQYIFILLLILTPVLWSKGTDLVPPVRTLEVPPADEMMVMDGSDDESCYSAYQTLEVFNPTGYDGEADLGGYFKLCWDMQYLYLFANVYDDIEEEYEWGYSSPWMYDCIELFLDLDTSGSYTSYTSTTIQLRFDRGLDSVETAGRAPRSDYIYMVDNTANGWVLEVGIPWTCVLAYGEDMDDYISNLIGFDLAYSDSDNTDGDPTVGNRDVMAAWDSDDPDIPEDRTEDNAWNNRSVFGIIQLSGSAPPPPPPPPPPPDDPISYIEPVNTMDIPLKTSWINIDAIDNESSYGEPHHLTLFNEISWEGDFDLESFFKVAWDSDYLYFFARILDDINQSWDGMNSYPMLYDNIEIYLDLDTFSTTTAYRTNSTTELRFCRGYNYVQSYGRAQPNDFIYATRNIDIGGGWYVEAAIPWTCALAVGASPEDFYDFLPEIGFDVIVTDMDEATLLDRYELSQIAWDLDNSENAGEIIEDNACVNTRLFGVATLSDVGFNSLNTPSDNGFTLYPNPGTEILNLNGYDDIEQISIVDINGRALSMIHAVQPIHDIDISFLQKGVYLLRVTLQDGSIHSLTFIKE